MATIDGITVYLAPDLVVKPGHTGMVIALKRLLFLRWLVLEGAKAIAVYGE